MDFQYTEEKLNSLDKETLIRLFLSQQEQLKNIDHTLQLEKDPEPLDRKMRGETGQDIQGGEIYS